MSYLPKTLSTILYSAAIAIGISSTANSEETGFSETNIERLCGTGKLSTLSGDILITSITKDGAEYEVKINGEFSKHSGGIEDIIDKAEDPKEKLRLYRNYTNCLRELKK